MTTDYIYNPVLRETWFDQLMNKLSDIFYGSFLGQFSIQFGFFAVGCAIIAAVVFAFAAR